MVLKRVEIEFIKGNDGWRERRVFEYATRAELRPGEYFHVTSDKEGEFYCDLKQSKVCWLSIEPISLTGQAMTSVDDELIRTMGPPSYSNMILAIKRHRELTGAGLKESKDYCENLRNKHREENRPS